MKNNTGLHLMMMGIAANKKGELPITNVATTGLGASEYSLDGDDFKTSILLQLISQDIDYSPVGVTGQMTIAGKNGPCISKTGGALYECKKIPLKYKGTGRYVAAPSKDVIYMTAGQWPDTNPPSKETEDLFHVSRNLRVNLKTYTVEPLGQYGSLLDGNTTYVSSDFREFRISSSNTHIYTDTPLSFGKVRTVVRTGPTSFPMKEASTSTILIVSMQLIVLLLEKGSIKTVRRVPVQECT